MLDTLRRRKKKTKNAEKAAAAAEVDAAAADEEASPMAKNDKAFRAADFAQLRVSAHYGLAPAVTAAAYDEAQRVAVVGDAAGGVVVLGARGVERWLVPPASAVASVDANASGARRRRNKKAAAAAAAAKAEAAAAAAAAAAPISHVLALTNRGQTLVTHGATVDVYELATCTRTFSHAFAATITAAAPLDAACRFVALANANGGVAFLALAASGAARLAPYAIRVADVLAQLPASLDALPAAVDVRALAAATSGLLLLAYGNGLVVTWHVAERRVVRHYLAAAAGMTRAPPTAVCWGSAGDDDDFLVGHADGLVVHWRRKTSSAPRRWAYVVTDAARDKEDDARLPVRSLAWAADGSKRLLVRGGHAHVAAALMPLPVGEKLCTPLDEEVDDDNDDDDDEVVAAVATRGSFMLFTASGAMRVRRAATLEAIGDEATLGRSRARVVAARCGRLELVEEEEEEEAVHEDWPLTGGLRRDDDDEQEMDEVHLILVNEARELSIWHRGRRVYRRRFDAYALSDVRVADATRLLLATTASVLLLVNVGDNGGIERTLRLDQPGSFLSPASPPPPTPDEDPFADAEQRAATMVEAAARGERATPAAAAAAAAAAATSIALLTVVVDELQCYAARGDTLAVAAANGSVFVVRAGRVVYMLELPTSDAVTAMTFDGSDGGSLLCAAAGGPVWRCPAAAAAAADDATAAAATLLDADAAQLLVAKAAAGAATTRRAAVRAVLCAAADAVARVATSCVDVWSRSEGEQLACAAALDADDGALFTSAATVATRAADNHSVLLAFDSSRTLRVLSVPRLRVLAAYELSEAIVDVDALRDGRGVARARNGGVFFFSLFDDAPSSSSVRTLGGRVYSPGAAAADDEAAAAASKPTRSRLRSFLFGGDDDDIAAILMAEPAKAEKAEKATAATATASAGSAAHDARAKMALNVEKAREVEEKTSELEAASSDFLSNINKLVKAQEQKKWWQI